MGWRLRSCVQDPQSMSVTYPKKFTEDYVILLVNIEHIIRARAHPTANTVTGTSKETLLVQDKSKAPVCLDECLKKFSLYPNKLKTGCSVVVKEVFFWGWGGGGGSYDTYSIMKINISKLGSFY